jgi:hypothetical protein
MRIASIRASPEISAFRRMTWQWSAPRPRGRLLRAGHLHWSAVQASVSKTCLVRFDNIMRVTAFGAFQPIMAGSWFGGSCPVTVIALSAPKGLKQVGSD